MDVTKTITELSLRVTIECSIRTEADRIAGWIDKVGTFRVNITGLRGKWVVRTYMLPSEIERFAKIKEEYDSR